MDEFITFDDVLIVPSLSDINSRQDIDTSVDFLGLKLRIPIISVNMDYVTGHRMAAAMYNAGGFGILHRFADESVLDQDMAALDGCNIPFIISVGIRDTDHSLQWIKESANHYPNLFGVCVDVAHGHHTKVADLVGKIKLQTSLRVIAGNVATHEGGKFLASAGADAIKCGIGAGAVCTTRLVAGVGVPQLSAIAEVVEGANGIPVIADGGIRNSGDIAKSIIAGATVVMIGSLVAGATECPSPVVIGSDNRKYRPYRGQSIFGSNGERYVREGIEGYVDDKGPVSEIVKTLQAGLRSSMSYVGAASISDLKDKGKFITVTGNTKEENHTRVRTVI